MNIFTVKGGLIGWILMDIMVAGAVAAALTFSLASSLIFSPYITARATAS